MAIQQCKECGKDVSTKAKTCPNCGAPVKAQASNSAGCLLLVGICVAIAMFSGVFSKNEGASSKKDWGTADNSTMAYIQVEQFVRDRLQSPSTASFPSISDGKLDHVKNIGGHKYSINSWVDAQNAFGGTVRNNFSAEVEQVSDDDWKCNHLDIAAR